MNVAHRQRDYFIPLLILSAVVHVGVSRFCRVPEMSRIAIEQGVSSIAVRLVEEVVRPVLPPVEKPVKELKEVVETVEPEAGPLAQEVLTVKESEIVEPVEAVESPEPVASNDPVEISEPAEVIEEVRQPAEVSVATVEESGVEYEAEPIKRLNPAPKYPGLAVRRGWEGIVYLTAYVEKDGRVSNIRVERSSGYGILDKSALKTVRTWTFTPGRIAGRAVASSVTVPVEFVLIND